MRTFGPSSVGCLDFLGGRLRFIPRKVVRRGWPRDARIGLWHPLLPVAEPAAFGFSVLADCSAQGVQDGPAGLPSVAIFFDRPRTGLEDLHDPVLSRRQVLPKAGIGA